MSANLSNSTKNTDLALSGGLPFWAVRAAHKLEEEKLPSTHKGSSMEFMGHPWAAAETSKRRELGSGTAQGKWRIAINDSYATMRKN
jgi:hypothetical protein